MSGDVASFDRQAFKESLASDLGVGASSVILELRPGSVVVFAAVSYISLPNFNHTQIADMGNAAASAAGANVLVGAEVIMGTVTLDAPLPSPPPSPLPPLPPSRSSPPSPRLPSSPPSPRLPSPPSPPSPPSLGFSDDVGGAALTSESGGVEDWAIGLIAVGVVLALVIVITGLYWYCVCKKTKQSVTLVVADAGDDESMMVNRDSDDPTPKSASAAAGVEAVELVVPRS